MTASTQLPARPTSPGMILSRELSVRGWNWTTLAELSGVPSLTLTEIAQGTGKITPDIAACLADVFGTSSDLWLALETGYRAALFKHSKV